MKARITPSALTGTVAAPPSKSFTHRAVIAATLAGGETRLLNPLFADDTGYTVGACRALGADIRREGDDLRITGTGGALRIGPVERSIYAGSSGSTLRMMVPAAALAGGTVVLDGDARLRQRPIIELLSMMAALGIEVRCLGGDGYPPVEIKGNGITGGEVEVSGRESSQHISGLLLAAPYAGGDITVKVEGEGRSRPYLDVTAAVMRAFGAEIESPAAGEFIVGSGRCYRGRDYRIEGDYSQAAYFLAAGAIGGGPVTVTGLNPASVQGDRELLAILTEMGAVAEYLDDGVTVSRHVALRGITRDMGDYPDIVQTVAAVAAFAGGRTELLNIGHLRIKETDRLADTAAELGKMGVRTEITGDAMIIYGGRPAGAALDSRGDHRMVMSLAVAACFAAGESVISGAGAVSKSYPGFFEDLAGLGARVEAVP